MKEIHAGVLEPPVFGRDEVLLAQSFPHLVFRALRAGASSRTALTSLQRWP